jgi:teichuronic acid biosynthesis glycosyltransferase TuaH
VAIAEAPGVAGAQPLILVLGTADWTSPIATNQHYVTRELAQEHACVFVEGTGTRRLRLTREDASRVARRLRRSPVARGGSRPVPDGTTVVSPRILPGQGAVATMINPPLLHRQVRSWLSHPGPRILWTFTPYTHGLERHASRTVYHLVDLLHENPGVDPDRLQRAEVSLAGATDVAIGTSRAVVGHLQQQRFTRVLLKPNVADTAPFVRAAADCTASSALPTVIFVGALSPSKIDFDLLTTLATRLHGIARVRLIGPRVPGPITDAAVASLKAAGVVIENALPIEQLSEEVAAAHVGLVPYQVNRLTRGVSPLKLYEYLAAGLPVVATAIPSVQPVEEAIWVESDVEEFAARVIELVHRDRSEGRSRRQLLAESHDWGTRGAELRRLVQELLRSADRVG